ncbi:MAG: efflux RND transporter periplasmic adaptor subunit [Clostridiales bacterium]|jgi:HlyD family secretion protein|nr:efflux RND transporter periplasmic adaptor subunit [Clostridiales bacterium]
MAKKTSAKKIVKRLVTLIIVALLIFGGYTAYQIYTRNQNMAAAREVFAAAGSYETEEAARSDVQEIVTASGVVYLMEENTIISESADKISAVHFEEGDFIAAGDTVVTYDVSENIKTLERKISESEIQLENARLNLESLTLPITETEAAKLKETLTSAEKTVYDRTTTLNNTQKDIELKQQEIADAQKTIESNKILLDVGAITSEEYKKSEQAVTDLNTALEKLYVTLSSNGRDLASAEEARTTAKYNLDHAYDVLTEDAEKLKYKQQENSVKSAEATLAQSKQDLAEIIYETKSAYSGTVLSVTAAEGASAPAGSVLYTVTDLNALIVKSDISEYDAPKLALGQTVNMTSDGIQGTVYTGKISKIAPLATTKTTSGGTESVVAIEISIVNPDGVLKPGFNLDIDIITVDLKNVLNIAQSALLRDAETKKNYVYTVNSENLAAKTFVETGLYGDMQVEILSGLTEGQKIISNPSDEIYEGMVIMQFRPGQGGTGEESGQMFGGNMMFGGGGGMPPGGAVRMQGGGPGGFGG